ncbi:MAG: winged helix-turn-helix domain-containing protein [Lentisphaeraceae bacterium]|nr:winged helix-turn-helix domain-containing protein [Lentisphaeraceae bacterium]
MNELQQTAICLAELGNETRLKIFRFLVKMGTKGTPVGLIQKEMDIPGSTLSHHISKLAKAGLIVQERNGRELLCHPQFDKLQSIIDFLVDECCEGEEDCLTVEKPAGKCC